MRNDLTQDQLKAILNYDPHTGTFKWMESGREAGCKSGNKYIRISIKGNLYYAHRLAWLYMTGQWPKDQIDHINGDSHDNRIANLREATQAQNALNVRIRSNSGTGLKGSFKRLNRRGYGARLTRGGKSYWLGVFDTPEEAHEAYCKKADELHGEFANYG